MEAQLRRAPGGRLRFLCLRDEPEEGRVVIDAEEDDFLRMFGGILGGEERAVLEFPALLVDIEKKGLIIDMEYVTTDEFSFVEKLLMFLNSESGMVIDATLRVISVLILKDSALFTARIACNRFVFRDVDVCFRDILPKLADTASFESMSLSRKMSLCEIIGQLHPLFSDETAQYLPFFHKCLYSDCIELVDAAGKSVHFMILATPQHPTATELFDELPFDSESERVSEWFFKVVTDRVRRNFLDFDVNLLVDKIGSPVTHRILVVLEEATKRFPEICHSIAARSDKFAILLTMESAPEEFCKYIARIVTNVASISVECAMAFGEVLPLLVSSPLMAMPDFQTKVEQAKAIASVVFYSDMKCDIPIMKDVLEFLADALVIEDQDLRILILKVFHKMQFTSPYVEDILETMRDDPELAELVNVMPHGS